MLTQRDLQELLDFKTEHEVVSFYLNTDPSLGSSDVYKLKLKSHLKHIQLPDDVEMIERYFDHEYDWSGKSVAIFSCKPESFFRVHSINIPIRSRVRVNNRPHVKPLADLFDSYGGYGVAIVDKQGARLFSFHLGSLKEQEGFLGEAIRRTKHGGGSQAAGRRSGEAGQTFHTESLADKNMRAAAEFATAFFTENNIRRVLLGGTDDNIALFRTFLPKAWQSLIVGTFPMSMTASHPEVLERTLQIGEKAEIEREKKLLDSVITGAAKGQAAVIGLKDTLDAIHAGRVQTLLISEGFRAPGYRCLGCGYLTNTELAQCEFCQGEFEKIADAPELAVRRTLRNGGEVDVLHNNAKLAEHGHIGAVLRY